MSAASMLRIVLAGLLVFAAVLSHRSPSTVEKDETPSFASREIASDDRYLVTDEVREPDEILRPLKRYSLKPRSAEISFFSFDFRRPYFGREGPNFTKLDEEPSAGAEYPVIADLSRPEAVSTAKFELVDQAGHVIQSLHFFKHNNSPEDGTFLGSLKVPNQPFRVAAHGLGVDGKSYSVVYERLFRPTTLSPKPPLLPWNLAPEDAKRLAAALVEMQKQELAATEKRASKHADGVIVMPRVQISNIMYKSFVSEKGNKLGIELSYDIRFSVDGDYAHSVYAFPNYADYERRALTDMEVLSEEISPKPEPPSYATPDIHVDLKTLVMYGSEAWYKAGVVYHFTVNLVPDFVGQNANKTKFCVDEKHWESKLHGLRLWQRMKRDPRPISYRIFINKLADGGDTEPFDPPKTYYDGFLKEGAVKCLPYKNMHF